MDTKIGSLTKQTFILKKFNSKKINELKKVKDDTKLKIQPTTTEQPNEYQIKNEEIHKDKDQERETGDRKGKRIVVVKPKMRKITNPTNTRNQSVDEIAKVKPVSDVPTLQPSDGNLTFSGRLLTSEEIDHLYLTISGRLPYQYDILDQFGQHVPFRGEDIFVLLKEVILHFDRKLSNSDPSYVSIINDYKQVPKHILNPPRYDFSWIDFHRIFDCEYKYFRTYKMRDVMQPRITNLSLNVRRNILYNQRLLTSKTSQARHVNIWRHVISLLFADKVGVYDNVNLIEGYHDIDILKRDHAAFYSIALRRLMSLILLCPSAPFIEKGKGTTFADFALDYSSVYVLYCYQLLLTGRSWLHGEITSEMEQFKLKVIDDWSDAPNDKHLSNKDDISSMVSYYETGITRFEYNRYDEENLSVSGRCVYERDASTAKEHTTYYEAYNRVIKQYPIFERIMTKALSARDEIVIAAYLTGFNTLDNPGNYIKGSTLMTFQKSGIPTALRSELVPLDDCFGDMDNPGFNLNRDAFNGFSAKFVASGIELMLGYMGPEYAKNPNYFAEAERKFINFLTHRGSGVKRVNVNSEVDRSLSSTKRTLEFIRNYKSYSNFNQWYQTAITVQSQIADREQINRRKRPVIPVSNAVQILGYAKYLVEYLFLMNNPHTSSKRNRGNALDSNFLYYATTNEYLMDEIDIKGMDTSLSTNITQYSLMFALYSLLALKVDCKKYFFCSEGKAIIDTVELGVDAISQTLLKFFPSTTFAEIEIVDQLMNDLIDSPMYVPSAVFPTGRADTSSNHTAHLIRIINFALEVFNDMKKDCSTYAAVLEELDLDGFDMEDGFNIDYRVQGDDIITRVKSSNKKLEEKILLHIRNYLELTGLNVKSHRSRTSGTYLQQNVFLGINIPKPLRSSIYTAERQGDLDLDFHTRQTSFLQQLLLLAARSNQHEKIQQLIYSTFFFSRYTVLQGAVRGTVHKDMKLYYHKFEFKNSRGLSLSVSRLMFPMFYLQISQLLPIPFYLTEHMTTDFHPSLTAPLSKLNMVLIKKYFMKLTSSGAYNWDMELSAKHGLLQAVYLNNTLPRISDIRTNKERVDLVANSPQYSSASEIYSAKDPRTSMAAQNRLLSYGIQIPDSVNIFKAARNKISEALTVEELADEIKQLDSRFLYSVAGYKRLYPGNDILSKIEFYVSEHAEDIRYSDFAQFGDIPMRALLTRNSLMNTCTCIFGPPTKVQSLVQSLNQQLEIVAPPGVNSLRLSEYLFELYDRYHDAAMLTDVLLSAGVSLNKVSHIIYYVTTFASAKSEIIAVHILGLPTHYYCDVNFESSGQFCDFYEGPGAKKVNALQSLICNYVYLTYPYLTKRISLKYDDSLVRSLAYLEMPKLIPRLIRSSQYEYSKDHEEIFLKDEINIFTDDGRKFDDIISETVSRYYNSQKATSNEQKLIDVVNRFNDRRTE